MSVTLSSLCSPNPSLKPPHLPFKFSLQTRSCTPTRNQTIPSRSSPIRIQSFKTEYTHNLLSFSGKQLGFSFSRKLGFRASAENGEGEIESVVDNAEEEARGQSTMPERFRHLTKEVPEPPVRWPWLIALAFLVYAWRTVLYEMSNWKKAVVGIIHFIGYLLKLALALVFYIIGDPVTSLIRGVETTLYTIRAFYSGVVAYAPVRELTVTIMLASAVLAIAEAAVPDSVNCQPYLLTVAGLIGYAAVRGFISELFFWTLLLGLFGFARLVKKRDYVSSALPVAAVLAAVGEPWVRVVVMGSYLALAITHHSKKPSEAKDEGEAAGTGGKVPLPLFWAALAIGVRVAAKWAGNRHLTWMVA
uniref:Embryo defective 1923 n=1 Tax=Davidia involucrata TaxID=16924 RepID=A0A5B7BWL3_DAVIN